MSRSPILALPDLDEDTAFREKLKPLADRVLPGHPTEELRTSGLPVIRDSAEVQPGLGEGPVAAAQKIVALYEARGPRRRFEYLLPERVGNALAEDAETKGMSAAQRLLEILRDAGYPVIPEDFTDVRKMRRR